LFDKSKIIQDIYTFQTYCKLFLDFVMNGKYQG